jgi:hypothetical protein
MRRAQRECRHRRPVKERRWRTDKLDVDAERLLALWESAYGILSSDWRERFLKRPEVQELCQFPDPAVLAALGRSRNLARIAEIAASGAWWYEGKPCEQDALPWCARCKPHPYPSVVVITMGWGDAFHRSEDCIWLVKGQDAVVARGGEVAPVQRVNIQVALGSGKLPCLWCFPPKEHHGSAPTARRS